ncbi:lysoplasmalogenase [Hanstruepera neustonica]|uniref:Lysoplasmalogenase n=1 Tax=Hanstruepera neustonica TaxID=1445657 RepID=A0A2K1DVX3_9FLAO|nr:lysoplasmalogenase [Hanstruepera neustonica]PNQ72191.1 lysoplasmalogenase [Hanstruepera neustonica]
MLTKSERLFAILFCLVLIFEMYTAMEAPILHYFAKPAILISLISFYVFQSQHIEAHIRKLTLGALVFSLLGDILLMFVDQSPHFFTAGLVSFLTAHVLYILVFLKARNRAKNPWLFLTILIVYGSSLFYVLKDHLGVMLLPVFFYMLVILTMATSAFLRKGSVRVLSYNLVLTGAILFLISDSLLAVNKFYEPLAYSNISIMFTYAFAQLFIVFGLLKQQ